MSQELLINVVYEHLQPHEVHAVQRGLVTVLVTGLPVSGADLYFYFNANSFRGKQPGLNILFLCEPVVVLPGQYDEKIWDHFDYIFTLYDKVIDMNPEKFKKVLLPRVGFTINTPITENIEEREKKYPLENRKNAICMINGNKISRVPGEGYSKRIEAALWFHLYSHIPFDVFGNPPFSLPNYKGVLPAEERFPTLANYKYGLCFENVIHPEYSIGYVDKILDCLESRTIPIYLGTPDINKYIPEECFIDFRKFKNYRELDNFLQSIDDRMYQGYIENIDRWVFRGGLRPFSMYGSYDKLVELLAGVTGNQLCAFFNDMEEWIPGLAPFHLNHLQMTAPAASVWTYQYLATARSPLIDYIKNEPEISPEARERLEQVRQLKNDGKLPKAATAFEAELSEGIFNGDLVYEFAQILIEMGRYEESFEQLMRVQMLNSSHSLALNDLAALCILKKEYKQAVQYLHQAIDADKNNYSAIENLIDLLSNLGYKDYVLQFSHTLLEQSPKDDRLKVILRKHNLPTRCQKLLLNGIKSPNFSLSPIFLNELSEIFEVDAFVETGTFLGGTTLEASKVFKSVYTIELSEDLFRQAQLRFLDRKNIQAYQGDSGELLPDLLKKVKGKIIFWLDGHYSEGLTAKAEKNSPILEELKAIKTAGITDAIILIDDLRMFPNSWTRVPENDSLNGYPAIPQLLQAIQDINHAYNIMVLGDILLIFPVEYALTSSPFILSCTLSRLYDETEGENEHILKAEQTIGKAKGEELLMINNLFSLTTSPDCAGLGEHYKLWKALSLIEHNDLENACELLEALITNGFNHWRIHWYLAQSAFHSKKTQLAEKELQVLLQEKPEFQEAQSLSRDLQFQ